MQWKRHCVRRRGLWVIARGQITRLLWVSKKKNSVFRVDLSVHHQATAWKKAHKYHAVFQLDC